MKTLLIEKLETLGYPVYLQGSISEDESYPPSFITFLVTDSYDAANYDNETVALTWRFQVAFYSSDPLLVASEPKHIRKVLKAAGFIPTGAGMDLPSDEPTHTGWVQDYYFISMEENTNE